MTVYIVHEIDNDISDARRFGPIVFINHRYVNIDELTARDDRLELPVAFEANIRNAIQSFDPTTDFLLIAGDHLQLLAVMARLAGRFPAVQVLRYERRERKYIPVWLYSGLVPVNRPVLGSSPSRSVTTDDHIGHEEHGKDRPQGKSPVEDILRPSRGYPRD